MNVFLLVFSILMNGLTCGIMRTDYCKKHIRNHAELYLFNAVCSILSAAALAMIAAVSGSLAAPSAYTLLMGVIFGLATALCAIFGMLSVECGPLSYSNIIASCSMIIPALSGMLLYGENVSAVQYVGAALMLASFFCAVDKKNDTAGTSLKWLILCLMTFFFNGSIGIMQKIHQTSSHKDELSAFLIIAFLVSALFSAGLTLYFSKKHSHVITVLSPAKRTKTLIFIIVSGIGAALCNQINMYLSGAMPAIIFYPVVNGGSILFTTIAGLLLFKEKFSRQQWLGMLLGALAILLLAS